MFGDKRLMLAFVFECVLVADYSLCLPDCGWLFTAQNMNCPGLLIAAC